MTYLGKARKEHLRLLAEELNLNVGDNMKIADLSKLITTHPDYDEEFSSTHNNIERRVPDDVREKLVDIWVKSIVPGDLADKLDEYESVRANVTGAHSNDTRSFKHKCFISENVRHLARECPKNTRKTPPRYARSNIITAMGSELEFIKEVVTARVSIPVSVTINTKNGIDDLRLVDIKCEQMSIKAVIDTGAQISVLREDLIGKGCEECEGTIQIISAFGEKEIAALKPFNLKIDDGKHGSVPIICAMSKKLRDFESSKDKDIEFRKEGLRKETENETRIREAMHNEKEQARLKAEVEARLKAEVETKAVEERRRMEEERRMIEIIALEEEMRLKRER
ncbi:retrovirus-related Pol polyprotein from transposon opus [Trichonephila inaurata madagascariensis]|uniref:Retrovirus-related Pol polyprotein from transposon opus n=1 Tax=Trichonephila inaurata madagascariensis TaxID=2747483 RepID=A0A8X6XQ50_9ARAC|nr:retrovirus-related Pol polyprotein from transposon opus [Trichonephila inaurata madagascariensis]